MSDNILSRAACTLLTTSTAERWRAIQHETDSFSIGDLTRTLNPMPDLQLPLPLPDAVDAPEYTTTFHFRLRLIAIVLSLLALLT